MILFLDDNQFVKNLQGGWETDESKTEAALRETVEEAGVVGTIEVSAPPYWLLRRQSNAIKNEINFDVGCFGQCELGKWNFKSKRCESYCEAFMFPLLVKEELEVWPEKNLRERKWVCVAEAREVCQYWWMKEALDRLVVRLTFLQQQNQDFGLGET